jgi:hypothetical protein
VKCFFPKARNLMPVTIVSSFAEGLKRASFGTKLCISMGPLSKARQWSRRLMTQGIDYQGSLSNRRAALKQFGKFSAR